MKSKSIVMAAAILTACAVGALAQSAPAGGVNGRDGNSNASGAAPMTGSSAAPMTAPARPGGADVRGASQSPSDPATIGTSGRDKQTGATKDKD